MRVALVLSAGGSRRFVGGNKLLAPLRGRPIVQHAVAAARAAPAGRVIVVVGRDRARVAAAARGPRVSIVHARHHAKGVGESLRAGLAALRPAERTVFLFLGDVPVVPPGLTFRLARALRPGTVAVRPRDRAGPGHPVVMRRPSREIVARLQGDRGLGALIAGGTRWIGTVGHRSADIDTRRDLARWR
nr:NTP transferase domain-containing protein [Sphingomonas profundi]